MFHTFYRWTEHFIVISSMVVAIIIGIALLIALIIFIHDLIEEI